MSLRQFRHYFHSLPSPNLKMDLKMDLTLTLLGSCMTYDLYSSFYMPSRNISTYVNPHRHQILLWFLAFKIDRLFALVDRVPGYTMEMYCVSCEVRTGFIYVCYVVV
jgi:hypothetical protein